MYGGEYLRKSNLRDEFNISNLHQIGIKTESKNLINNNQIFNINNQSTNYLIEYFEGIMLNYISLHEYQGIRNDKLKNFILSHNKNIKFKGGDEDKDEDNVYIKDNDTYKEYKKDEDIKDEDILLLEDNWKDINIEVNIDYGSTYDIHINHSNGNNVIDLIIDLQHNTIIDDNQKSYNNRLCDFTKNIEYILTQIIERLLKYIYEDLCDYITLYIYDENKNVINKYQGDGYEDTSLKSIISLLIMILTLKNNAKEDIYKKYNTTFLLSGIYKKFTPRDDDIDYTNSFNMFDYNNINILTYSEDEKKHHLIEFGGDCALNTLMCVKNEDIRKLFVDKIGFSQKKSVNEEKRESEYYVNKINEVFKKLFVTKTFVEYIDDIKDYIKKYSTFINFINNEYSNFKNSVINKNYTDLDDEYQTKFEDMYKYCLQFIDVIRNNLLDYNLEENEIEKILTELDKKVNRMKDIYEYERYDYDEKYTEDKEYTEPCDHSDSLNKFIEIIDIIINYKDSFNIFYINLLISLLLTQHKIDYLFDNDIIKILNYSKNKTNIIKCFRNVGYNEHEYSLKLPAYQKGDGDDKYLFQYVILKDINHAVILIININAKGKKLYLYDLNHLMMYCTEDFYAKRGYEVDISEQGYWFDNKSPRWIIKKYISEVPGSYEKKKVKILLRNIFSQRHIKKSLNKINIFTNGQYDFEKISKLNYNDCDDDNFNSVYYNYKKVIFEQLLNFYNNLKNEYVQSPDNDFLYVVYFINNYINNNIINYDNNIKNTLYKFIDCLVQCKYNLQLRRKKQINIDNEYKAILKYIKDIYYIDLKNINKYLDFIYDTNNRHIKFINDIIETLCKLNNKYDDLEIVRGGSGVSINCYNSIIKKILIILLVIVIIIVIVLIVLFIINKYKNNKNNP